MEFVLTENAPTYQTSGGSNAMSEWAVAQELPHFPAGIGLGTLFLIAGIVFR
jgi:hypothetical protein